MISYKLKKRLLIIGILGFIVLIILFSIRSPRLDKNEKSTDSVDFYFQNVKISEIQKGKLIWQIKAEYANLDKDTNRSRLSNIKATIYDSQQNKLYLIAPTALISLAPAIFKVDSPNAHLRIGHRQIALNANWLCWDSKAQLIQGTGAINIKSPPFIFVGERFEIDIPMKTIQLIKNCRASIQKPSKSLSIL